MWRNVRSKPGGKGALPRCWSRFPLAPTDRSWFAKLHQQPDVIAPLQAAEIGDEAVVPAAFQHVNLVFYHIPLQRANVSR